MNFERPPGFADRERDHPPSMFELGLKIRQINEKTSGQRRNGSAFGHPHLGPAIEEAPQRTVGFAQVDIFAARLGEHGREFGVGQRAEQRQ